MKHVCIATGTRADWGILRPVADALRRMPRIALHILATNMHLMEAYGHTADAIEADGFTIDARVPMPDANDDSGLAKARAMGTCLSLTAAELDRMRPDAIVILGDRFEMLAVASAAMMLRIPIVHLHGGEITEGAVDDCIRHAITKMATLHLTAAEPYRRRVISLGEDPAMVVNIGSPGVWNLVNSPRTPRAELCASLDLDPALPYAVATFHPATLDTVAPALRCRAMLDAFDRLPGMQVIVTYPNNDPGSHEIIELIESWGKGRRGTVVVKSLGMYRYLSAVAGAAFVAGNSSSAIIEVPAAGIPAVNIGIRQKGRLHSNLVIDCGDSADEIEAAMRRALDPAFVARARLDRDPYYKPDTPELAAQAIARLLDMPAPLPPKKFHES